AGPACDFKILTQKGVGRLLPRPLFFVTIRSVAGVERAAAARVKWARRRVKSGKDAEIEAAIGLEFT
ncbi:MAG: hypothetical protein II596_06285, partial [Thermoguttaceae bacterium]|nr:hypothetical protein [Thermoguttaceae bacterium]